LIADFRLDLQALDTRHHACQRTVQHDHDLKAEVDQSSAVFIDSHLFPESWRDHDSS